MNYEIWEQDQDRTRLVGRMSGKIFNHFPRIGERLYFYHEDFKRLMDGKVIDIVHDVRGSVYFSILKESLLPVPEN